MTKEEATTKLGIRVKAVREERNMSEDYFALTIRETNLYVQLLEKGRLDPPLVDLIKICRAFNMSLGELLGSLDIV